MKLFIIFAICVLATTSASMMAFASPTTSDNQNGNHLNLQLRNVYFQHNDLFKKQNNWSQDGQAFQLNFESIYLKSFIGFNASYYGVIPLSHSGNTKSNNHFLIDEKILAEGNKGYQKLGQAYAKIKFNNNSLHFNGKIGLMAAPGGLIQGSSSRATPASYTGAHGNLNINDMDFYATFLNGISNRTFKGTHHFVNQDNKKIKHIWQTGVKYNANNIKTEAVYAQSDDYAKQYALTAGYTFDINSDLSISMAGTYQKISKLGSLWDKTTEKATFKNLNSHFRFSNFKVGLSYFTSKANAIDPKDLGIFKSEMSANEYGGEFGNLNTYTGKFLINGEKVWQLSTEYDFSGWNIPGFSATITYLNGKTNPLPDTTLQEEETNIMLKYTIHDSVLKGMSFKILKAWGKVKYYQFNQPHHLGNGSSTRAYIDYTVAVF